VLSPGRGVDVDLGQASRKGTGPSDRLRVLEVGINGRDDDARVDRGQNIDAEEGDACPLVDNDSLIEHAVDHVDH
jgi:hypothetical protein